MTGAFQIELVDLSTYSTRTYDKNGDGALQQCFFVEYKLAHRVTVGVLVSAFETWLTDPLWSLRLGPEEEQKRVSTTPLYDAEALRRELEPFLDPDPLRAVLMMSEHFDTFDELFRHLIAEIHGTAAVWLKNQQWNEQTKAAWAKTQGLARALPAAFTVDSTAVV